MSNKKIKFGCGWIHIIPSLLTSMIGYNIHGSLGWAIFDFFFYPIVWIKWLILKEVNLSIIKDTFSFFFQ